MVVLKANNLIEIVKRLISGQVVIFSTETSYGMGCDATNRAAVDKIFKIKKRERAKSLLVVVPNVEMAKKYLEWNDLLEKISKKYWLASAKPRKGEDGPGPLTVVGERKRQDQRLKIEDCELAEGVVSSENTLALRVTNHHIVKQLAESLGKPLVATSANISDEGDIYDPKELIEIFSKRKFQPDILLDGGKLPRRKPSTIVSVVGGRLKVLRQGEVKIKN